MTTAKPPWGRPVRLAGGHLTHYAGMEHGGSALLAHGDFAWADTFREPLEDGRVCPGCGKQAPARAAMLERLKAESAPPAS